MTREDFAALVEQALADVPPEFAEHLENIVVVVEDEPAPELLRSLGLDPARDTLFGLYHGIPLPDRGATFGNALPDQISIYYRPLLRAYRSPQRIRREIRRTVIHEIAHYFGMDDHEIEDLGY